MKEETMNRLVEAVKEKAGTECDIELKETRKNNGTMLQGILIKKHGEPVSTIIYIDSLIDRIEECSITIQDAAEEIIKDFNEGSKGCAGLASTIKYLDTAEIYKKVVHQVIGKKKNNDMLADVPHKELLDLAAVYRVVLDENSGETVSFLLTNALCETYGIDSEELEHAARRNTEMRGFEITAFSSVLEEKTGIPKETLEAELPSMYIVSNAAGTNGAAVMLYWKYFDKLAHELQSDLYILPSSIHEVIAVPAVGTGGPAGLRDMVREINAGGNIADDEILSDSVYFYSLKEGVLCVA